MASESQAPEDANGIEPTLQFPADIKPEEDESELGARPKRGVNSIRLQQDESELRERVRKGWRSSVLTLFCLNGYSAVLVFVFYLISLESLLSIALAVSLTVCKCHWSTEVWELVAVLVHQLLTPNVVTLVFRHIQSSGTFMMRSSNYHRNEGVVAAFASLSSMF